MRTFLFLLFIDFNDSLDTFDDRIWESNAVSNSNRHNTIEWLPKQFEHDDIQRRSLNSIFLFDSSFDKIRKDKY